MVLNECTSDVLLPRSAFLPTTRLMFAVLVAAFLFCSNARMVTSSRVLNESTESSCEKTTVERRSNTGRMILVSCIEFGWISHLKLECFFAIFIPWHQKPALGCSTFR